MTSSSKTSSPNFKRKTARMSVKTPTYVNLQSSSEEHQNDKTPSPPPRKKSLSPPHAPSKSTSSKSTHYTSLSPSLSNLSSPPRVSRPLPRFLHLPPGFEQQLPPQPLFVNINNNAPQLENTQNLPPNLGNQDFPNPPNNILDFKEKKIMHIDEIPQFCYATLKRVLEKVKKINLNVKHGYANPALSNDDAEFMRFYEEYIHECLRHRDQMRRKPSKLRRTNKPKLLENPNPASNCKQHHVQSDLSPGSSLDGHRCGSKGVFQTSHLLCATEKLDSGIPSCVPYSDFCGIKRKSQAANTSDVFDRYSQLYATNVLSRFSSNSRHLPDNNGKGLSQHSDMCISTQLPSLGAPHVVDENSNHEWAYISKTGKSLGKEIVLDFGESAIRLEPTERQLEKALLNVDIFEMIYVILCQSSRAISGSLNESSEKFLCTTIDTTPFKATGTSKRRRSTTPAITAAPFKATAKRVSYDVAHRTLSSEGSPSKRRWATGPRVTNRRTPKFVSPNARHATSDHTRVSDTVMVPASVSAISRRTPRRHTSYRTGGVHYVYKDLGDYDQQCYHCGAVSGGRVYMEPSPDPPDYIKHLLQNSHFLENIRAYNQMFAMTSFGAKIDESINNGRGPYVFKLSGQHELENRLRPFGGLDRSNLDPQIVEGLIHFLDTHNELIRLYNADGARGYELPTSNSLWAIVFDSGLTGSTEFDVVIEQRGGLPQRINKLHKSCMSLQFPLLFIYRQLGFHIDLKLRSAEGTEKERRLTMLAYYSYQLHPRVSDYNLIFRGGRLFQQGERDGYEVGGRIILPMSFTGGPRYMYAHYLDALAICRKLGNPQFFITFTSNVKWPEMTRYMEDYPQLTASDRPDIIREPEDVDRFISDELPDPQADPEGYRIVMYQRRDTGVTATKHQISLNNSYVVPYNRDLLLAFQAHINVEPLGKSSDAAGLPRPPIDEVYNYLEGRFVCPYEAIWRIYRERDKLESVVNLPGRKSITLTKWFAYNANNEDGRHLTYLDFPSEFVWYADRKSWSRSQNSRSSIGRLAYVHPTSGELFYFRMLLCHQKGCRDFPEVQTVHNIFYPTCRAACEALGLLGDDKEWDIAMEEASISATSSEFRFIFAHILTHCEVTNPLKLWANLQGYILYELEIILNNCVLAVASSGIASLLLPSGRTAHSRFKLPIELTEESLCKVTKNSQLGKLLADTNLIIWDEAPMNDRRCFEALDRSLRDILTMPDHLFGGKSVLLGGDFRQTLPVKKGASKIKIIASCISESELWPHFNLFTLTENMRLSKPGVSPEERSLISSFASWLLDLGDGRTGEPDQEDFENNSWVDIPLTYCIPDDEQGLSKLIGFIYDKMTLKTPSATTLQEKAIVCPKNEPADMINSKVLEMIPGFPPHQLQLKIGAPVMLLRNVNVAGGLCNGTRMIVRQVMTKLIEVQIITGTRVDYIGCIRGVGALTPFRDLKRAQSTTRKIEIENLNGNIIELILWDEMAEHFEQADLQNMEQPIIIAVSSCRVSKYRDYQLAASPATYYYLNPNIPEAAESRQLFKAIHQQTPPLIICKFLYKDTEKEKLRNRYPLKTLMGQNPLSYKCGKVAITKGENYTCLDHGPQPGPFYRYKFKRNISDSTGTAPLTFFSPAAEKITPRPCKELVEKYKPADPKKNQKYSQYKEKPASSTIEPAKNQELEPTGKEITTQEGSSKATPPTSPTTTADSIQIKQDTKDITNEQESSKATPPTSPTTTAVSTQSKQGGDTKRENPTKRPLFP
ncbi:DNA helicase [Tanacetum coccineum]